MSPPSTTQPHPATFGSGIHHATPVFPTRARTTEAHLVKCVLQMIQGFPSSLFQWDPKARTFALSQGGTYLATLSLSSLHNLVARFVHAATCLKLVEVVVGRLGSCEGVPTLRAFASSASQWLQRLRSVALKEEVKVFESADGETPTLLGVLHSLSRLFRDWLIDAVGVSLCSGAENLLHIVNGAIPQSCFEPNSGVSAAEIAVYILDSLYKKLDEVCHVEYGEEAAYQMVLHMFVGSVFPCIQGLDSWLFEGMLDDPFEEMFFYANKAISVDEPEFWEKSYQLRQVRGQNLDITPIDLAGERDSTSLTSSRSWKELKKREIQVCPVFLKEIANSIVSAGKSLQLIRHVYMSSSMPTGQRVSLDIDGSAASEYLSSLGRQQECKSGLTLSEIFCLSVVGLIGHGDHISRYFAEDELSKSETSLLNGMIIRIKNNGSCESLPSPMFSEKTWFNFFVDTLKQKKKIANKVEIDPVHAETENRIEDVMDELPFRMPFCPETPAITVCQAMLANNPGCWKALNLSRNFHLPPLNDEALREAVFGTEDAVSPAFTGTNYSFGFQFGKSEHLRLQDNLKMLESLFPFPTLLPSFQENVRISELLPFQKNNTLMSRVLDWIESVKPRITPLPAVIMHECLIVYVKEQVDNVGRVILSKLMKDWRLIDELAVLRAIYLLGSGDLLQHFLTIIFNKLDKGETWDDDFELNTMLQESIRNSADAMLLSSPHSLVVSISQPHGHDGDELPNTPTLTSTPRKGRPPSFSIDGLESLTFTYEVPWPLELIANTDTIKKYNHVMRFLLKVKRAKFVLDKARRWMWKDRRNATNIRKEQWLLEQKLLHFVDAFHQYVMDRVYHSAWRELCDGMAAAGSLDEVIEVHEAYLLSIQRQCFVVPDKLCTLIGIRVNTILGLALEFYSIQQTLNSGAAASAMKSRCEMEINRIEKQFDDCIAFLLRVLSPRLNASLFPHVADLVTRINYNYFYMSDSGSLMMATSSEVSRPGKAFRVRKD